MKAPSVEDRAVKVRAYLSDEGFGYDNWHAAQFAAPAGDCPNAVLILCRTPEEQTAVLQQFQSAASPAPAEGAPTAPSDDEVLDFLVAYYHFPNRATIMESFTDWKQDIRDEVKLIQSWATLMPSAKHLTPRPAAEGARSPLDALVVKWRERAKTDARYGIGKAMTSDREYFGTVNAAFAVFECADELAAALAGSPGSPEATGWQPMSTCPKDGRRILVCDANLTWETRAITPGQSANCKSWMDLPTPLPAPPTQETP